MNKAKGNVYTIVVTHNGQFWIRKCLKSLLNSSTPTNIIVIDNASGDNTIEYIDNNCKRIKIVKLKKNIGFGQANNIGFKIAKRNRADFVFLLNQDAWVETETIHNLISAHISDNKFGLLSPVHFNGGGNNFDILFHKYFFGQLLKDRESASILFLNQNNDCKPNKPYIVDFVNAAAWMLPVNTVIKVGGFDPLFFHWGEDRNYVDRIKYHDLKVGVCTNAKIYHDRELLLKNRNEFYKDYYFRKKLRILLNPNIDVDIQKIKSIMFKDILKSLAYFNIHKANNILKAYLKLQSFKDKIADRKNIYKNVMCFL